MKNAIIHLFLFVIVCICSLEIHSQIPVINTVKVEVNPDIVSPIPNFIFKKNHLGGENIGAYIGQEIITLPISDQLQEYGYHNIISHKELKISEMYGCAGITFMKGIKYDSLVNKTLIVDSIKKVDFKNYVFYIHDKNEPIKKYIYHYQTEYSHTLNDEYLIGGYYNYLKSFIGNSYKIIDNDIIHNKDIENGKDIIFPVNQTWKVINVGLIDRKLCLMLSNNNQTTYVRAERFSKHIYDYNKPNKSRIFNINDWNAMVKRYGTTYMQCVKEGAIKVGMPSKLVILSWGKPDEINRSSYGDEQWVYGYQYVYINPQTKKCTAWN